MDQPEETESISKNRPLTLMGLADVCSGIIGFSTLAGFAGAWWWILDLCSHFRLQYFFGALILAAYFGLKRQKPRTGVAAGIAVINLIVLQPYLVETNADINLSRTTRVKALWWNVQSANQNRTESVDWIIEMSPDLIALGEITPEWEESLSRLKESYPFDHIESRQGNFGIALFSRLPLFNPEILYRNNNDSGVPTLQVELNIEGKLVTVMATHPLPPVGSAATSERNSHLQWLSRRIQGIEGATILFGDLNATPWNHAFKSFIETSRLQNLPTGIFTTWPSSFAPLRIPLDYCLVSKGISVRSKELGPSLGSDHLPVMVQITW
jgi:endonuclease/exonuclease/phosphatase (EEP) superfamily protein YafD